MTHRTVGVILAVAVLVLSHGTAVEAACQTYLLGEAQARFVRRNADRIVLVRVGATTSDSTRLHVLRTYRGDVEAVLDVPADSLSCSTWTVYEGKRAVYVSGDAPRWGPFTWGFFEGRHGWHEEVALSYATLRQVLHDVDGLPATSTESGPAASPGPIDGGSALVILGSLAFLVLRRHWRAAVTDRVHA